MNDRGLAMTSSFTNMVLAGQCVGHLEADDQFGEMVAEMSDTGRQFLPAAAEAAAAMTMLGCTRTCFVGAGVLRAVADESGLKVVELSAGNVTAMAETPLGLRHGPLSSLDSQTLFVVSYRVIAGGAGTNSIYCGKLIASVWDECGRGDGGRGR